MQFKFDANQEYQKEAINAIADIFEGQPPLSTEIEFAFGSEVAAVPNRLDIDENIILQNVRKIQERNGIVKDATTQVIEKEIDTVQGKKNAHFLNFSVEMETGTGKTYVYLRTALELYRRYGFCKYIVVVPSIAIREGVMKTLSITEKHFKMLYGGTPYRYYEYDSKNINKVKHFALSDSVEILVMTLDSFNKSSNVLLQQTDRMQGQTPLHFIQETRPILILDEPQNMKSELQIQALAGLNPLFALRYSATHVEKYHLMYQLTPYDAYRQGLVKKIEVDGITENNANRVFLKLNDIVLGGNKLKANLSVHKLMKSGTIQEATINVGLGDKLGDKTGRPEYAPYIVAEISYTNKTIRFKNDVELSIGEATGTNREAIFETQIRHTILEHIRKQKRLKPFGIKVLSLFFIDKVDNYKGETPLIRETFERIFNELKHHNPDWAALSPDMVQAAYFASRKTKTGEIIYEDSKTGESEKDKDAYDLIMKDKERLLSMDEPVCFIFSHSALREGWDNPNVFQICTMNQAVSMVRKRQEIGRGVRLAVNHMGERVFDRDTNVLTVIANESYQEYVSKYQLELDEEYGTSAKKPPLRDKNNPKQMKLRKEFLLSPEFQALWEKIKHKTRYSVKVDTMKLVDEVVEALAGIEITSPYISSSKAVLDVGQDNRFNAWQESADEPEKFTSIESKSLPNVIELMENLMNRTSPKMKCSRNTLLGVVKKCNLQGAIRRNPQDFALQAVRVIKHKLAEQLAEGIQYTPTGEWYKMEQFKEEIDSWGDYLIPAERSLYDYVEVDSLTSDPADSNEGKFVLGLEKRKDVKLYVKLPAWFTVDTPIGTYNPDWAIVLEVNVPGTLETKEMLYLVRETKSTTDLLALRDEERQKIQCGLRHFRDALNVDYQVVNTAADLRVIR